MVCTVVITFLLTRAMGAESFGMLSLLVANAALLNLVTCLGAESGITYHYSGGTLQRRVLITIAHRVILFQLLALIVVELVYHYVNGHFFLTGGAESYKLMLAGLLYFGSIVTIDKYQAFFNAAHRYNEPVRIMLVVNLLSLAAFAYFHFGVTDTLPVTFIKIFIGGSVLQCVLMMIRFHYSTGQPLSFTGIDRKDWKIFFSYSAVVLITNIIQFLAYRIDYWLIDYYKGPEQLGFYALAVRLGQLLWIIPLMMAGILFPRIAGNASAAEEDKWMALVRISNVLFVLAALMGAILSPWAIPFFAGEAFTPAIVPFIYLLPGLIFFCFNIVFAAWFAGKGMLKVNLTGSALCLILVLLLDLWLIPRHGIKGAAVASSVAYTVAGLHHLARFAYAQKKGILWVLVINRGDWQMIRQYLHKYTAGQ